MNERLEIRLLGGLLIRRNGEPVTNMVSRKAQALVAYLARHSQPLPREVLANLLWDDRDQSQAAGNLRVVLSGIRKSLAEMVQTTRQTVEINPTTELWVDANVLEQALLSLSKHPPTQQELSAALVAALETGVQLFQGEFLAGFSLNDAQQFEIWASQERERFQILVQEGLDALVAHYLAVGQYTAGIERVQRWLQIDPLNENALRQLLRLLGGTGQRNLAIQSFGEFRSRMIEELGVEPSPETVALYEQLLETEIELRQTRPAAPGPAPLFFQTGVDLRAPLPHNLPSALMPIVGRDQELEQIQARLLDDACRLLTLTGIGGIGKTRLALEAAQRLLNLPAARTLFSDGIYFVRLEPIDAGALVPSVIAEALNFQFQGKSDPQAQMLAYLRSKRLLLLMDNFEHLVEQSDFVLEILHHAPQVKVLATSRERLDFAGEWLIDVHGLPYLPPATHSAELLMSAAAQFFVRCATAVQPNFTAMHQRSAIAELCHLLEGSPLGLLLAAAAVRSYPCQQIVEEIKRNLDFLAGQMRNLPERHRTLRAVFVHSWALLSPVEQQALQKLAIFPAGFSADAAYQVAQVPPGLLQILADKSLLQYGAIPVTSTPATLAQGYKFHRTLYPFVWEKLQVDPALLAGLQAAHCAYFARFLAAQNTALKGVGAVEAMLAITMQLENVRIAWHHAATHGLLTNLEQSLESFARFYLFRGPLTEAQTAVEEAITALRNHFADSLPAAPQAQHVLGCLLAEMSSFYNERGLYPEAIDSAQQVLAVTRPEDLENQVLAYQQWGAALHLQARYSEAQTLFEQSIQLAEAISNAALCARSYALLSRTLFYQGHYPTGRRYGEQAVAIYQELGERYNELNAYNTLAMGDFFSGDYSTARTIYLRTLEGYRAIKDERTVGRTLNNLGAVAAHLGEYSQAQHYYQEALAAKRAIGDRPIVGLILANLSLLANRMSEYQTALDYSREALALSQELGERDTQAYTYFCLGHALAGLGQLADAAAAYRQSVALRHALGQQNQALEPLAGLARLHLMVGDLAEAQTLVEEILPHLQQDNLAGIVELIRLYLTSYQVLEARHDPRAREILPIGVQILQARAAKISDLAARESYLSNVVAHRELLALSDQPGGVTM